MKIKQTIKYLAVPSVGMFFCNSIIHAANPAINSVTATIKATDTNTTSEGTRDSETNLMMAVNNLALTRKATVVVTPTSGEFCEGYPKWSGLDAADGETEAKYESNESQSVSVTLDPNGGTKDIKITAESGLRLTVDVPPEVIDLYTARANTLINLISDEEDPFKVGGEVSGFYERVDFYNDGSKTGHHASLNGTLSVSLPSITNPGRVILIPSHPLLSVQTGYAIDAFSIKLNINGEYNEGLQNKGSVKGSLTGGSSITITVKGVLGLNTGERAFGLVVAGTATTGLEASGSIEQSGLNVSASGHLGFNDIDVKVTGELNFGFANARIFTTGDVTVIKGDRTEFPSVVIYVIGDDPLPQPPQ